MFLCHFLYTLLAPVRFIYPIFYFGIFIYKIKLFRDMELRKFIATTIRDYLNENIDDLDRYTIDDNFYLYKDNVRQFSATSKKDLIQYLQRTKPELINKFGLESIKDKKYSGVITLYRGHGYNEGNNFYSPSKEFALEFTRTGREGELTKVKVNTNRIYKHNPLPRGYGEEDENFDIAIQKAKEMGFNAIWVDEGLNQPNSVFKINVDKPF